MAGITIGAALLITLVTHWSKYREQREAFAPIFTLAAGLAVAGVTLMRHFAQTNADRARRVTDTFSKAVEQLGGEKVEVRLGGIYTLERLAGETLAAEEAPDLYWTVMETLTGFVRERARWKEPEPVASEMTPKSDLWRSGTQAAEAQARPEPATDTAAVLAVIGRRPDAGRERELLRKWRFDLRVTDLRGAYLIGAHLEYAVLGGAHLEYAGLHGAHLESAFLREAYLEGADLRGAHLEGANLGNAHLEHAYLHGAHLEAADLNGAILNGADLSGGNLNSAILSGANLTGANLSGADLSGAKLRAANLGSANLRTAKLSSADLSGVDLSAANLGSADLSGADLNNATLQLAELSSANLRSANLAVANLSWATLIRADLNKAALWSANLSGANLSGANLSGADLQLTELSGADLRDARGLTQAQLDEACGKPKALPPGLTLDKPCPAK
jgi:uncharacterized protein YjbI with pentapeptide repeats